MSVELRAESLALLKGSHFAQLATINSDGTPHIDTVWYDYQNHQLIVATTQATLKAKNLQRSPNAYVVITHRDNPYEQLQMKVRCADIKADDDLSVCDSIAIQYTGNPFPQRHHKGRVAIHLDILSEKHHIAKV